MPNWCDNTVWFEADQATMQTMKEMFLQMAEQERATNNGQLPPFVIVERDWFYAIRWEEEALYYETRHSPNIEVLQEIADHYNAHFTVKFDEMGDLQFGRATYADGILNSTRLGSDDFEAYSYDEETDTYHFEGEEYDFEYEILETLLERKIEQFDNTKNQTK